MIHPDTTLAWIDARIGYGLFATRPIPKGTITWIRDPLDQVISAERYAHFDPHLQDLMHRYAYRDSNHDWVLCWDNARFVNHSCAPTCLSPGLEIEVALRDIAPGEQLTDDYASLQLEKPFECLCGAPACRGTIRASDAVQLQRTWAPRLGEALESAAHVAQPLRHRGRVPVALAAALANPASVTLPGSA